MLQLGDFLLEEVQDLRGAGRRSRAEDLQSDGGSDIEEGQDTIEDGREKEELAGDLAFIAAAQKVEHYEIANYETARTLGRQTAEREVARLLSYTLGEEESADFLAYRVGQTDSAGRCRGGTASRSVTTLTQKSTCSSGEARRPEHDVSAYQPRALLALRLLMQPKQRR